MHTTGLATTAALMFAMLLLAVPAFAEPTAATTEPTAVTGATGSTAVSTAAKKKKKKKKCKSKSHSKSKCRSAQAAAITLSADGAYRYRGRGYVLPRTRLVIRGRVKADLDGQKIKIRIHKRGHLVKSKTVSLDTHGKVSKFHLPWRTGGKGRYSIKVDLTGEQQAMVGAGKGTNVAVVRTSIHRGSRGVSVRLFQHSLRRLAYVSPLNGHFDAATGRAFIAFRKVNGMSRRPVAGRSVARKLAAGRGGFRLRYPGAGRHVEVSIRKQVMAFASNGRVVRIYHVSTGKPSTPTVRGTYRVYMKDPGTNAKGMVKSSYFIRGYAIHGYAEVPMYAASHGCVRVPVPSAASIFRWVRYGTRVDTY